MLYDQKWDTTALLRENFFLPAKDLGLTARERAALVRVLAAMEAGELIHSPDFKPIPGGFNMSGFWAKTECGTVGCIAGWADRLGGTDFVGRYAQSKWDDALFQLFLGPPIRIHTTPAQAARALRAYLTRGAPDWSPTP